MKLSHVYDRIFAPEIFSKSVNEKKPRKIDFKIHLFCNGDVSIVVNM